jgi:hypothetical protein
MKKHRYYLYEINLVEIDDGETLETYARNIKEANEIAKQIAKEKGMEVEYVEEIKG